MDTRYLNRKNLSRQRDRRIDTATDRLTGQPVILKASSFPTLLHEARCLLALPPGIAPQVHDILWEGGGSLTLVLEYLEGRTLDRAAPEIPEDRIPHLAWEISYCLAHVHRSGWIHSDLKPQNILLLDEREGSGVRLLDFGFAIHRYGLSENETRGGTPGFMAPELLRGWIVDDRADLYSLGETLNRTFHSLSQDPRWVSIIEKLQATWPARRHRNAVELAGELAASFRLTASERRFPPFGAGPLRGRDETVRDLVDRIAANSGARILVQGRPGIGLSRLLQETVLAVASAGGPAIRVLDLSRAAAGDETQRGLEHLEELLHEDSPLVCGVGDPSPNLCWLHASIGDRMRGILSGGRWERITIPALELSDFDEITAASTGKYGPGAEELARSLYHAAEGDLKRAAAGFQHFLRAGGSEQGSIWTFDPTASQGAIAAWNPAPPEPRLEDLPAAMLRAIRLCGQAGFSFQTGMARAMLDLFAGPGALDQLLEHGYLMTLGTDRARFITRSLWREAATRGEAIAQDADLWLNEHRIPDPDDIEEVLQVCRIARRVGDSVKEARVLTEAIKGADRDQRYLDILKILAYPDEPPAAWTKETVAEQAPILSALLGPDWSEDRIAGLAGAGLWPINRALATDLLEQAARSADPRAAASALVKLIDHFSNRRGPEHGRYMARLREIASRHDVLPEGIIDFLEAMHLRTMGRSDEALLLAKRAASSLSGSGSMYEILSHQLVAIFLFSEDPVGASATLRSVLRISRNPEREVQIRINLCKMYINTGRLTLALGCIEEGIRKSQGRITPYRSANLRNLRAGLWADLDRVEPAMRELRSMLGLSIVQSIPSILEQTRIDLITCYLHRGAGHDAIREALQSWSEAAENGLLESQWMSLRVLIDVILDLDAWDLIPEFRSRFNPTPAADEPIYRAIWARAEALLEQARGNLTDAAARLEAHRADAFHDNLLTPSAKHLHHLGLVLLGKGMREQVPATAAKAARLFEEELDRFGTEGRGYHRGRALLSLYRARRAAGQKADALDALSRAIELARSIQSPGLLKECLEERARDSMEAP